MTPERFRQVRNLFEATLEKAPDARMAFLREAAQVDDDLQAQVRRMLDAYAANVSFLDGAISASAELRTDPRRMEGRRLGAYEILREIGRGGMGTVYLAHRVDGLFEQQVAIKVVNPESTGREVKERFEQERSILASLDHPNIARLYDGGSTEEGWPYFVMEYVNGKTIDVWCEEQRLNVSDRIRLFGNVCKAVQYALEHHVIHRDLKPGNILVTGDGTVKLLDFGIAKLVHIDPDQKTAIATRTGMRLMTPEYASPEQIRAEETTPLTDLYSLGVILYELVTGRRPYRLKSRVFHEIVRVVCEVAPTRPSSVVTEVEERIGEEGKIIMIAPGLHSQSREGTPSDLKRRLSGDLDAILLRALEKDPRRRYRTVNQFRIDLDRHLKGEPVLASSSNAFTDALRLGSKHRLSIVLMLALLVAFLTGGIRVDWLGFALIAGAASLLGLWYLATDRELGSKVSEKLYGHGTALLAFSLIAAFLCIRLGTYLFPAWKAGQVTRWVLTGGAILGFAYVFWLLCAWTMRERWAGSLQTSVRLRSNTHVGITLVALASNFWTIGSSVQHDMQKSSLDVAFVVSYLSLISVLALYVLFLVPLLEVRDRGLVYQGHLISWLNIESYEWEGSAEPGELVVLSIRPAQEVLRLHVSRLFSFLPPPRIRVPSDRQQQLAAILDRHLSEWPQS